MMIFLRQRQFIVKHQMTITIGLASGVLGLIISFSGRGWALGRAWGDPLPMVLAVGQFFRNPLYFNWRGVFIHVIFAGLLGVIPVVLFYWRMGNGRQTKTTTPASQLAALINVGTVAITEVDAPVVAIWYLMGGYVSVLISTLAGKTAVSLLNRLRREHFVVD